MDINNFKIYNTTSNLEVCELYEFTHTHEVVIEQSILPVWYVFEFNFLWSLIYSLFTCNFVKMFVFSVIAITIMLIYIIIMWLICYVLVLRKIALFKSIFE